MADSLVARLEKQLPGFKAYFGGGELRVAASALAAGVEPSNATHKKTGNAQNGPAHPKSTAASAAESLSATLAQSSFPDEPDGGMALRALALTASHFLKRESAAGPSGQDYETTEARYRHALLLQDLAGKLSSRPTDQLHLLHQACDVYASVAAARPSCHAVLYNWGVALSEIAQTMRDTRPDAALRALQQAAAHYERSLCLHPGNVQALNNWGLVLKEMSTLSGVPAERNDLVQAALEKFRRALRLRPEFDRGCYNLGTVLYMYASGLLADLAKQLKVGRLASQDPDTSRERHNRETRARNLFAAAAQYICLAAALQPAKDIYRRTLTVVKPMLPRPFLRAGYLTAPLEHTLGGPSETWRREWFVLDTASLRSASAEESSLSSAAAGGSPAGLLPTLKIGHAVGEVALVVPLDRIMAAYRCHDPSLPEGEALWVQLSEPLGVAGQRTHPHMRVQAAVAGGAGRAGHGTASEAGSGTTGAVGLVSGAACSRQGDAAKGAGSGGGGFLELQIACAPACCCIWLVADDAESADAWVDALLMAHHVVMSRSADALAEMLTPAGVDIGTGSARSSEGGAPQTAGH